MRKQHWQDVINLLLGVWVFISPWVLQRMSATAVTPGGTALNFYAIGIVVFACAIAALNTFRMWEEWVNVVLGLWLLISPWIIGYSTSAALMWNAVILGVLVAVFAGWSLSDMQRPPTVRA